MTKKLPILEDQEYPPKIEYALLGVFMLCFALIGIFSIHLPFFWDNVLLSSQFAHHFYENGFSNLILAKEIDCGHPPFFGYYIALAWKLFGYSLTTAHLAMLPFLWLIAYSLFYIVKYFVKQSFIVFCLTMILVEPSLMGQATMVSNDVVLTAAFLWGWYAILYNKKHWIIPATLLMTAVNIRGALMVFILFAIGQVHYLWQNKQANKAIDFKLMFTFLLYFLPSFGLFLAWNGFHYSQTGWALAGQSAEWAEHYEKANLKQMVWNGAVIGKNMLDFGRVFVWLGIVILLFFNYKLKLLSSTKLIALLLTLCTSTLIFTLVVIGGTNPIGHRYLIVFYLMAILIFFTLLKDNKFSKIVLGLVTVGLLSGNFWVYPDHIAQGWDSTLGHIPYFKLREKMYEYIASENIPTNQIGAGFTMYKASKYIDLQDRNDAIGNKNDGLDKYQYIFYSNVINNFSDEELKDLDLKWDLKKEFSQSGVSVKLFERQADR